MKKTVIDVDAICMKGKKNGVSFTEMFKCLEISKQRLYQLREGSSIETMQFLKLCEVCKINLLDWENYTKEIEVDKK